jgi:hypothetical protein
VKVSGDVPKPVEWDADAMRKQFASEIKTVKYSSKGQAHLATCVPLLAVLEAAGVETGIKMDPKADPKTKHRPMRLAVEVRGSDGYAVVLSLAELLPSAGNHPAWLALDEDGKALSPAASPARLIVPEDATPVRWVRGVVDVRVVEIESGK